MLAELIDNSNGVCPLKNAKINELSDVRAQILYEKDFYKSHPILNCTVHSCEEFFVKLKNTIKQFKYFMRKFFGEKIFKKKSV